MALRYPTGLDRLQRTLLLVGAVTLSVLATALVERLPNPSPAVAQTGPAPVVRASTFELVNDSGAVLARITSGGAGNGSLTLFDTAGNRRAVLAGNGTLATFDADGSTLRFYAGYALAATPDGRPPVNGVALAPDGTVGMLEGCTGQVSC